ncbi:MAG TPA: DUF4352 domain-containing protein [Candidatus Acidoferrales bacterium]
MTPCLVLRAADRLQIRFCVDQPTAHLRLLVSILALTFAATLCGSSSAQNRSAAKHAQPIGLPLSTIVIFGDQYNGGDELYDVRITVEQAVRGEKAWQIVKDASASNKPPAAGSEYVLARIRFEFSARVAPEHYSYTLDQTQFTAMSGDDRVYDAAVLAKQPEPALHATLRSGDSAQGWVAFQVPRGDHTPLMLFRENVGSVIHEGGGSIFKLYNEGPSATGKSKAS